MNNWQLTLGRLAKDDVSRSHQDDGFSE